MIFFKELRLRKPDYFLDAAAQTAAQTIANVVEEKPMSCWKQ